MLMIHSILRRIPPSTLLFALAAFAATAAAGSSIATNDPIPVKFGTSETQITFAQLSVNSPGAAIALVRPPLHGDLIEESDRFRYVPDDEFWSIELDSFVYRITDATKSSVAMVPLHASRKEILVETHERFETQADIDAYPQATSGAGHTLTSSANAELEGDYGLEVAVDQGYSYLTIPRTDDDGLGGGGGGTSGWIGCLPSDGPPLGLVLAAVGGAPEAFAPIPPSLRVVTDSHGLVLQARTAQGWTSSKAVPLGGDSALFSIEWWINGGTYDAILRVDGHAARLLGLDASLLSTGEVHIGLIPDGPGAGPTTMLAFDDIRVYSFGFLDEPSPIHAMDDFENGDTAGWSSEVGTNLAVKADAAATGLFGLEADAAGGSYLLDTAPSLDAQHVVQFHVDFNDYDTTHGDISTIFALGQAPAATTLDTLLRLRLYGGAFDEPRLLTTFANATTAGSTWSPTVAVAKGPATLTLQILAATSADHPNGHLRVWLDETPIIDLHDLDSVGSEADWLHLGLYGTDPGTTGSLSFDDFVSSGR